MRELGAGVEVPPAARKNRGTRADTYTSLVEVLLDSEAAHPAVALGAAASQRRQKHKRPHPLHLAQESALRDRRRVTARQEDRVARRPIPPHPAPQAPGGARGDSPAGATCKPGRRVRARVEPGRRAAGPRFIAPGGGGRTFVTTRGERPRGGAGGGERGGRGRPGLHNAP